MAYKGGRSSPGPTWAALNESAPTPSSTNEDDEDELEEDDETETRNNGYRSSTPLKRKNEGRSVREQGITKRPRHAQLSGFNEGFHEGYRSARGEIPTGNASSTSLGTSSRNETFQARSKNLSMNDPLTPRFPSSIQTIASTSAVNTSTISASQPAGRNNEERAKVKKVKKKRYSLPDDLRNGKFAPTESSVLILKTKQPGPAVPSSKKFSSSAVHRTKVPLGSRSEDDNPGSTRTKISSHPSSAVGTNSKISRMSMSLGKKKSLDRMDVDEDGQTSISTVGKRKDDPFLRDDKSTTLSSRTMKKSTSAKSIESLFSKPSGSASVNTQDRDAGSSTRRHTHSGPPSAIKLPKKKERKEAGDKPQSSQPIEIIDISDDDWSPISATQPISKVHDKLKSKVKKEKEKEKEKKKKKPEVLEILDTDEECELEKTRSKSCLASRSSQEKLTEKTIETGNEGKDNHATKAHARKRPVSTSHAPTQRPCPDKQKRKSLPNFGSRESEVIVISDSEDDNMKPPSPTALESTSASRLFDDLPPSPVAEASFSDVIDLQSPLANNEESQKKAVELSQGVDALSLMEEDPMSVDDNEHEEMGLEFLIPPPKTPSPPPETVLEPARAQSSPSQLETRMSSSILDVSLPSHNRSSPSSLLNDTRNPVSPPTTSSSQQAPSSVPIYASHDLMNKLASMSPLPLSSSSHITPHLNLRTLTKPIHSPTSSHSLVPTIVQPIVQLSSSSSADHADSSHVGSLALPTELTPTPPTRIIPNTMSTKEPSGVLEMSTHGSPSQLPPPSSLFLPASSSSAPSSSPPPPQLPLRKPQTARKSTGGKTKKRSMDLGRRGSHSMEMQRLPVTSSEPSILSTTSELKGGHNTSGLPFIPQPTKLLSSGNSSMAPTSRDKDKSRISSQAHISGRQSIADAINLAGASNAQLRRPRKPRVESGPRPSTIGCMDRTPGLSGEDIGTSVASTTIVMSDASAAAQAIAKDLQSAPGIPEKELRTSKALQELIHKKKAEKEGISNQAKSVEVRRASTDELSLRPSDGIPGDEKVRRSFLTPPGQASDPKDESDNSDTDAQDSAECVALLEYTDERIERFSTAENSEAESRISFEDGNLSDELLGRRDTSPSGGFDDLDELDLHDRSQLMFAPSPPSHDIDGAEGVRTYGGIPALVWKEYRKNPENFYHKVHWARDLPHTLQDHINSMTEGTRMYPQMRNVLLAAIRQNTIEDEPNAPDIVIENEVDDEPTPPWEFHYSNQMWHADDVPPPDMGSLISCDCIGKCDPRSKTCACVQRQGTYFHEGEAPDFVYDNRGRLKKPGFPIFECNDLCGCDENCRNRVVQNGRKVSVMIAKTPNKGWGVFNGPKKIPKGTFLGIYSGELITDAAGEERGMVYNKFGRTYLFDLDFHHLKENDPDWNVKYTVDAYHAGNFTRFLNHSCDPNARLFPCYINEGNLEKPLLAVFAIHDVEPREEICFSYSGDYPDDGYNSEDENEGSKTLNQAIYVPCLCGSARCTGKMFK